MPTLFSTPSTPKIPTPTVMPTPDTAADTASQQQQLATASRTSGRLSTIMTSPTDRGSDSLG